LAVVGPKAAILISPCLKSEKLESKEVTPEGLKKVIMSY
jgi:hypothetical protein